MRDTVRRIAMIPLALVFCGAIGCADDSGSTRPPGRETLAEVVEAARVRHRLPAVAVASFSVDRYEIAVQGVRRAGGMDPATPEDRFHIGSNGKAILATAIARLQERGLLSWTLTLAEAFPGQASTMHSAYREVTLAQLLAHRGGLPALGTLEEFATLPDFPGSGAAERIDFVTWVLARPPAVAPGSYLYSNAGYAVAAAIAEQRTGLSWEAIVQGEVLDPLGIRMFVGWPLDERSDAPAGHVLADGNLVPVTPEDGRIPAVLAPAGDYSMTMADYARFGMLHLRALAGTPALLTPATFDRLHRPETGDYALGWKQLHRDAANTVLDHEGNSEIFYSYVVLFGQARRGFAITVNAVGPGVEAAVAEILEAAARLPVAESE